MHVLGGLSLLIVIAVASTVRAGIEFEHGDGPARPQECDAADAVAVGALPVEAVAPPSAPLPFGPLRDRMRP